jgi:MFS transporter, ACS family, tartrate transporter
MPKQSLGQRTIAKTSRRLLPLIVGICFAAYLDRTNVGIAALGMNKSLGFSGYLYGWGAGIFSGLLSLRGAQQRHSYAHWSPALDRAHHDPLSIISGMMALVSRPRLVLVLRFLLGVAGAGFCCRRVTVGTWSFRHRHGRRRFATGLTDTGLVASSSTSKRTRSVQCWTTFSYLARQKKAFFSSSRSPKHGCVR